MTDPTEQEIQAALDEVAAEHARMFPDAGIAEWYEEFKAMTPEQQIAAGNEAGAKTLAEMQEMHGDSEPTDQR